MIERYGCREISRIKQLVAASSELRENLCVAAHLAHVTYAGRIDGTGATVPKYTITLATKINEAACRKVNLCYLDPNQFSIKDYECDPDTLIVEHAGRDLYRPDPH